MHRVNKTNEWRSIVVAFLASALVFGAFLGVVQQIVGRINRVNVVNPANAIQGVAARVPESDTGFVVPPGVYVDTPGGAETLANGQAIPTTELFGDFQLPDAAIPELQYSAAPQQQQQLPAQQQSLPVPSPLAGFEYIGSGEQAVEFGRQFGINVIVQPPPIECGIDAGGCAYTDGTVYIHPNSWDEYLWMQGSGDFLIRHEFSHIAIDRICGTMDPLIANYRTESVTDAYALLFMEPNNPNAHVEDVQEQDLAAAQQIHAGNCG